MGKDIYELTDKFTTYEEMMNTCRTETRERIAEVLKVFLPYSDTPEGRILLEEQLYSVLIQMLTYIQVNNRRFRKERQAEGIEAAKASGVHFGRQRKYFEDDHIDVFKRLENGEIDRETAILETGASPSTFARMYQRLKSAGKI